MGKSVVFLHPDLGIGGAERLVVDAALALQSSGYSVAFLTNHHQPPHCFPETADGTLRVVVVASWFPRAILGRFMALCAYIRMVLAALYLVFPFRDTSVIPYPDIVFCDQVSACIPVLRLFRQRVLFYCHFPDMLLSIKGSRWKSLYRWPLDRLEEWSTGLAHKVLVNSHFTEGVFRSTFESLSSTRVEVLYPTLNVESLDAPMSTPPSGIPPAAHLFLSLNRFERKKNVRLAILAFEELKELVSPAEFAKTRLVIAGGYDSRVAENVEHFAELNRIATERGLSDQITFLKSPNEKVKQWLLCRCTALLYTPSREHFGIVPLEAMYCRAPVIAVNSGGPLETVMEGETGYLRAAEAGEFGRAMAGLVREPGLRRRLGDSGRRRVLATFAPPIFARNLHSISSSLLRR